MVRVWTPELEEPGFESHLRCLLVGNTGLVPKLVYESVLSPVNWA